MIKWCSYCQRYLGEIEPLTKYQITHGICPQCMQRAKEVGFDEQFLARLRALGERLMSNGFARQPRDVDDILREGRELGLRPVDLAVGVIQPSLYRIGELWASGEITVQDEHRFTAFAKKLVDKVSALVPENLLRAARPSVLLARPQGNEHHLGVSLLGLHLASEGITSRTLPKPAGSEEILAEVRACQPKILGLSISMIGQAHAVAAIAAAVRAGSAAGRAPEIAAGGLPFRNHYHPSPSAHVETFRDTVKFAEYVQERLGAKS